jgi:hypothetical protein
MLSVIPVVRISGSSSRTTRFLGGLALGQKISNSELDRPIT